MWLAFLLSFRSDSDPHLDSAYATSQYCFLFFQHKFCLILCRAVASDEDFESTVFTFYTLIFCQEAKLFFCDFEDDFGFFSRLKGYLAEIFQLFHRAYHRCGYVVDVKLYGLGSLCIAGVFHGYGGFNLIFHAKLCLVQFHI